VRTIAQGEAVRQEPSFLLSIRVPAELRDEMEVAIEKERKKLGYKLSLTQWIIAAVRREIVRGGR
jgi:hypothetical protein